MLANFNKSMIKICENSTAFNSLADVIKSHEEMNEFKESVEKLQL